MEKVILRILKKLRSGRLLYQVDLTARQQATLQTIPLNEASSLEELVEQLQIISVDIKTLKREEIERQESQLFTVDSHDRRHTNFDVGDAVLQAGRAKVFVDRVLEVLQSQLEHPPIPTPYFLGRPDTPYHSFLVRCLLVVVADLRKPTLATITRLFEDGRWENWQTLLNDLCSFMHEMRGIQEISLTVGNRRAI